MGHPFPAFVAELAGMAEGEDVSIYDEEKHDELHHQVAGYVRKLPNFIKADETFLVEDLLEWQDGLFMTAKGMLTAIVEAESHR